MMDQTNIPRKVCIAPMMGWTDRHERYFLRLMSPNVLLYTVMLTTGALIHGDADGFLKYNEEEHPLALQLGGADPKDLATCAKMGQDAGYDEINLNCGCPSDRVQNGNFGACLMAEPNLVADCIDAMKHAVDIPVTIKTRIGIDDHDEYEFVRDFVGASAARGCDAFIIHARKAWLNGLSPKENRTIPPLKWDVVYQLKQDFPEQEIIINGGIKTLEEIQAHLEKGLDGVMLGREAYHNPYLLTQIDRDVFGASAVPSREDILDRLIPYIERETQTGTPLKDITRHILGLYQGQPGARKWRRLLSENAYQPNAGPDVVKQARQQRAA